MSFCYPSAAHRLASFPDDEPDHVVRHADELVLLPDLEAKQAALAERSTAGSLRRHSGPGAQGRKRSVDPRAAPATACVVGVPQLGPVAFFDERLYLCSRASGASDVKGSRSAPISTLFEMPCETRLLSICRASFTIWFAFFER